MTDLSKYSEIIIWGANISGKGAGASDAAPGGAVKRLHALLEQNGEWGKVIFFVDSNPLFQGRLQYGKEVRKPADISEYPNALVIVNTISIMPVQKTMADMGIKNDHMIIPYYYYHGAMGNPYSSKLAKEHTEKYRKEITELFDTNDPQTRRYLDIIFTLRERAEDDLYSPEFYAGTGEKMAYFCDPELAPGRDVTLIDAGAFVGDSIEPVRVRYGERLKKVIAFEPDSSSFELLTKYVKDKCIDDKTIALPYALGAEDKEVRFKQAKEGSSRSEYGDIVLQQKVFDELPQMDIVGDAMVKMDIEGAELEALQGMKRFIQSTQPYLAICLYHKVEDLYDVPHYIKAYVRITVWFSEQAGIWNAGLYRRAITNSK